MSVLFKNKPGKQKVNFAILLSSDIVGYKILYMADFTQGGEWLLKNVTILSHGATNISQKTRRGRPRW